MEWLKPVKWSKSISRLRQMSLRKSLFVIIIGSIAIGIIPYFLMAFIINVVLAVCLCDTPFVHLVWILPFVIAVSIPILASVIFYKLKLKKPLSQLNMGAKRIMENDLDFSIEVSSKDELGQLCESFEAMRLALLKSNQALWQQMEERKRLNAAFAHDLRNPVTVLKGSAALLEKGLDQGHLTLENAKESISLITQYSARIENYIGAMTSVQKLEQLTLASREIDWLDLTKDLESSLFILSINIGKDIQIFMNDDGRQLWVDVDVIHNVAENLVSNALRYGENKVQVEMSCDTEKIVLCVKDDGVGFSKKVLDKGAVPFLRDDHIENEQHFGMGLYICHLLCEKHGGELVLENDETGAKVTATFCLGNGEMKASLLAST